MTRQLRLGTPRRLAAPFAAVLVALPGAYMVVTAAPAGAATVSNVSELRDAWDDETQIDLLTDVTIDDCGNGPVTRTVNENVVLDGHGFIITQTCQFRVLQLNSSASVTLRNVTLTGGRQHLNDGGAIDMNGGSLLVVNSSLVGNCTDDDAGAIENENGATTIISSTIANNDADDDAGAIRSKRGMLTIIDSTITGNTAADRGAIDSGENDLQTPELTIVYSTIVENAIDTSQACATNGFATPTGEAGTPLDPDALSDEEEGDPVGTLRVPPANIFAVDVFNVFGTVVALPVGGPNCEIFGTTSSSGYNFSDDASCLFTNTATGDRENAGDPGLGALASNGGPTQTLLPTATSPLVNFIPLAACGGGDALAGFAVTTDQRGITRPQATGCEIGSVEIQVIVVEPTFTG